MQFGWRLFDNSMLLPPNFRWMKHEGLGEFELEAEEMSYRNLSLDLLCVGCVLCVWELRDDIAVREISPIQFRSTCIQVRFSLSFSQWIILTCIQVTCKYHGHLWPFLRGFSEPVCGARWREIYWRGEKSRQNWILRSGTMLQIPTRRYVNYFVILLWFSTKMRLRLFVNFHKKN